MSTMKFSRPSLERELIFRMMRYTEQVVQNHLEFMWDELMRTYEEYVETPITYLIRYIKRREAKK